MVYRECLSGTEFLSVLYVCASFPFGFDDGMWDLIVLVPGHCLSFYYEKPY